MTMTDETLGRELAAKLIAFLETGTPPEGAVHRGCVLRLHHAAVAPPGPGHRRTSSRCARRGTRRPGRVPRSRFDATTTGFVLEVEEEWDQDGESWYCRELFRADVADGAISQISVYCTGDWDRAQVARHRATVELLRP